MKLLVYLTFALCLSMVLANPETFLKVANQLTKRSAGPRQIGNCDANILQNYPADCLTAFRNIDTGGQTVTFPQAICDRRCGQPAVNFYISCDTPTFDFIARAVVQLCGTNAMGRRCLDNSVQTALTTTSSQIATACSSTISGSACTVNCRNTLNDARQSPGCCVNVLNTTGLTNVVVPAIDRQLWEQRCNVSLPSPCPSSLSGSATLTISKTILAFTLFLLGTLLL